ncbi:hypothetical protein GQ457_11G024230 [Hibiscus cannabinus]
MCHEFSSPLSKFSFSSFDFGVDFVYWIPRVCSGHTPIEKQIHPNNQERKLQKHIPKNQENRTTPIPGARKVGAQGEDQTLGIYMSSFGPKFNLIPN